MKFLLFLILKLLNILPEKFFLRLGGFMGRVFYAVSFKHKKYALENINIAFPEMPACEKKKIIKKCYVNLGMNLAEFILMYGYTKGEILNKVKVTDLNVFNEIKNYGNAVILSAHYGNWELGGAFCSAAGFKMNVIVRPLKNKILNSGINFIRERYGMKIIQKQNAVAVILRLLKEKNFIGILFDQNAGFSGEFVNLFNKSASTYTLPAMISVKKNLPVYLVVSQREKEDITKHKFIISENLMPVITGNLKDDIIKTAQKYNDALEKIIKSCPHQWLWLHRRWKTRPGDKENQIFR